MTYLQLTYAHLATVLPAFAIGTYLLMNRKGTKRHRQLGIAFIVLMLVTSVISLLMEARVGPQLFGHFGAIHSLSILTLISVPIGYYHARNHNVPWHRGFMIGVYSSALIVAGAFALAPGRLLHEFLFG